MNELSKLVIEEKELMNKLVIINHKIVYEFSCHNKSMLYYGLVKLKKVRLSELKKIRKRIEKIIFRNTAFSFGIT